MKVFVLLWSNLHSLDKFHFKKDCLQWRYYFYKVENLLSARFFYHSTYDPCFPFGKIKGSFWNFKENYSNTLFCNKSIWQWYLDIKIFEKKSNLLNKRLLLMSQWHVHDIICKTGSKEINIYSMFKFSKESKDNGIVM